MHLLGRDLIWSLNLAKYLLSQTSLFEQSFQLAILETGLLGKPWNSRWEAPRGQVE